MLDIKGGVGNAEALFVNEIPKPEPKGSEAIVKIKAFGLNRMDLLQREGHYPVPPQAGKILGVEFSGIVESFGSDAEKDFKIGDEVFGLAYGGALLKGRLENGRLIMEQAPMRSTSQCLRICLFTNRKKSRGRRLLAYPR